MCSCYKQQKRGSPFSSTSVVGQPWLPPLVLLAYDPAAWSCSMYSLYTPATRRNGQRGVPHKVSDQEARSATEKVSKPMRDLVRPTRAALAKRSHCLPQIRTELQIATKVSEGADRSNSAFLSQSATTQKVAMVDLARV